MANFVEALFETDGIAISNRRSPDYRALDEFDKRLLKFNPVDMQKGP